MFNPDGRPRRGPHQRRRLDDFLVTLPPRRLEGQTDTQADVPVGQTSQDTSAAILLALQQIQEDNRQMREESRQLQRDVQFLMQQHHATPPRSPARDVQVPVVTPGAASGVSRGAEGGVSSTGLSFPTPLVASSPLQQDRVPSPAHSVSGHHRGQIPDPHISAADTATPAPRHRAASRHPTPLVAELTEHMRSMNLQRGQHSTTSSPGVATPRYVTPYSPGHPSSARHQSSSHSSEYQRPAGVDHYRLPPVPRRMTSLLSPPRQEQSYRGPKMKIPVFSEDDPRQFNRMQLALENVLPPDATERFKYQILLDHLKLEDAVLVADAYCHRSLPV